jgi:DNA (cytosine-5)-methyltransferase 1
MSFTIGSLFDGSGGFPLAATMCGGVPVWASEIEPYPIAVTKSRFPNMKHLGSVTDVKGNEVEPVDVITFGSPCQDLSVAGKRAGLKHESNGDDETTRSGLFMEAVRIIKEMRKATNGTHPRFAIWENVPGAFSSNKGEDFRTVCEELIKIVEPAAVMPAVPQNGWPYADLYCGSGWSLAYRVFDAQYWGVPQRRRRIYLVADFGGECAGKVLFERKGLRGYFAQGGTQGQGTAPDAERSVAANDRKGTGFDGYNGDLTGGVSATLGVNCGVSTGRNGVIEEKLILDDQGGQQITVRTDGKSPTLRAEMHGNIPCVMEAAAFCAEQSAKTRGIGYEEEIAPTIRAGVVPACVYSIENHPADSRVNIDDSGMVKKQCLFENHSQDTRYKGPLDVCPMLPAQLGTGGNNTPFVVEKGVVPIHDQATRFSGKRGDKQDGKGNGLGIGNPGDPMNTLTSGDRHAVAFQTYQKVTGPLMANSHPGSYTGQDAFSDMLVAGVDCRNMNETPELYPTLQAKSNGGQSLNYSGVVRIRYIVRRLTPTECARLQGFADRWAVPDYKEDFTEEEYQFWLQVRNTHAEINGKAVKDYTKPQMLAWYNKLHTDSSEYKLWGNGIALPTALYVMQGISDAIAITEV